MIKSLDQLKISYGNVNGLIESEDIVMNILDFIVDPKVFLVNNTIHNVLGQVLKTIFRKHHNKKMGFYIWEYLCGEQSQTTWDVFSTTRNYHTFKSFAQILRNLSPAYFDAWYQAYLHDSVVRILRNSFKKDKKGEMKYFHNDQYCGELLYRLIVFKYIKLGEDLFVFNKSYLMKVSKKAVEDEIFKNISRYITKYIEPSVDKFHADRPKTKGREIDEEVYSEDDEKKSEIEYQKECLTRSFQTRNTLSNSLKFIMHMITVPSKFTDQILDKVQPFMSSWSNCVIESRGTKLELRKGIIEDFSFKSTRCDFPRNSQSSENTSAKLHDWLDKMFPDLELKDYVLKVISSCFYGENSEKSLYVLTGVGNNSKSVLINVLKKIFGDYMVDLPSSIFNDDKTSSSGATPELMQMKNAFIGVVNEPKCSKLSAAAVKRFTGNDEVYCRGLYKDASKVKMNAKIFYICNELPGFDNPDQAVMNRVCCIPFFSKFSYTAPKTVEEQFKQRIFPIDTSFENKTPELIPEFILLLKKYFSMYKEEGLVTPKIVRDYTDSYWNSVCEYNNYINANLSHSEGSCVSKRKIISSFKIYMKNENIRISSVKHTDDNIITNVVLRLVKMFGPSVVFDTENGTIENVEFKQL